MPLCNQPQQPQLALMPPACVPPGYVELNLVQVCRLCWTLLAFREYMALNAANNLDFSLEPYLPALMACFNSLAQGITRELLNQQRRRDEERRRR